MSKPFFEALLETFAREAEAGVGRIILLVLDNAGWHGAVGLKIPDGIRLVYLPPPPATPPSSAWRGPSPAPPYSPQLQPAETLWALLDEPIVNKHIATIEQLEEKIANQCVALAEQPDKIQKRTGFHWWPKRISSN